MGYKGGPGRPKGSRNKLGEAFLQDMYERWQARGVEAINKTIDTQPAQFLRAVASLMPQQLEVKKQAFDGVTDEQLDAIIAAIRGALGIVRDSEVGSNETAH